MPTRPGALVAAGSLVLIVVGRLLGLIEGFVLGGIGLALVGAATAWLRWHRPVIAAARVVHPNRVHAGTASRVELSVTNRSGHRTGVVSVEDHVSGTGGAHLLVAPLGAGQTATAAYRLPTDKRGIVELGPLSVIRSDPFGLARQVTEVGLRTELTVLPRIVKLLPLPHSLGDDPLAGAEQPNHLGRGGEDFYALRAYVVGDDLRRVHWPSTARTGDLLVRQDEQPWQGRITVMLDTRRAATDPVTFEDLVTAAASIVTASRVRGDLVRLCTTSGYDTGFVAGHAQIDSLMEHLAVVDLDSAASLAVALAAMARGTGTVVAVVGDVPQPDLDQLVAARAGQGGLTLVQVLSPSTDHPAAGVSTDRARRAHVRLVRVSGEAGLADAWNRAMTRRGARAR